MPHNPEPEPVVLPAVDDPPADGVWRDHDDITPTAAEIAEGNRLGATIDPHNDHDNGGVT